MIFLNNNYLNLTYIGQKYSDTPITVTELMIGGPQYTSANLYVQKLRSIVHEGYTY